MSLRDAEGFDHRSFLKNSGRRATVTAVTSLAHWEEKGSGFCKQQSTRPQTLATDSPVGHWIYEKIWAWTDNQGNPEDALTLDEMLDKHARSERNGVLLPSGCRQGACGTCATRLLSGKVRSETEEALNDAQRAQGVILPCVSRPLTDVTLDA